jgi:hypothetical protein
MPEDENPREMISPNAICQVNTDYRASQLCH